MPTFTPPVTDGRLVGDPFDPSWAYFKFLGSWATGKTVWKDSLGVWHESIEPYAGGATTTVHDGPVTTATGPDEGLATAQKVYLGGHEYTVTEAEATELAAAGFGFDWWQLTDWTHSWDAEDSEVASGRATRVVDRRGNRPLIKLPNPLGLFGADPNIYGSLPGPLYLPASPRFNNRPALYSDSFPAVGALAPIFAGLSPNGSLNGGTNEPVNWFNSPTGYPQPYWVAVLARLTGSTTSAVWDAQKGDVGTGPTIGADIFGGADDKWEVSLFGPDGGANKIEVNHVSSADETVLVFVYVNGASSFMEVTWKDGAGVPSTLRQTGTLGAHTYFECFLGWVHDVYWTATGIKLGTPTEPELDFIRTWATAYIPAAAVLPPGV